MTQPNDYTKPIHLTKPIAGELISHSATTQSPMILDFDTSTATLMRVDERGVPTEDGSGLLFFFDKDGSSILLTEFYTAYDAEHMPTFIVQGQILGGEALAAILGEDLMPAAGPSAAAMGSGSTVGFLSNQLLNSHMDSLDGLNSDADSLVLITVIVANPIPEIMPEVQNTPSSWESFTRPISTPDTEEASIAAMQRVTLTVHGNNNITALPHDFERANHAELTRQATLSPVKDDPSDNFFGKAVVAVQGLSSMPQDALLGIASVEGQRSDGQQDIRFHVLNEYGKNVALTLQWDNHSGTYTAQNAQGNIFFSLVWDGQTHNLTMQQYRLFTAQDGKSIDIEFAFVDVSGALVSAMASASFASIDNFVSYELSSMENTLLDVTDQHDHEQVLIKGDTENAAMDSQMGEENRIITGSGEDSISIISHTTDKGALTAVEGSNAIYGGTGHDVITINAPTAMQAQKNGVNHLSTGKGADSIYIEGQIQAHEGGINTVSSGKGDDYIFLHGQMQASGGGKNSVEAGQGNDLIRWLQGNFVEQFGAPSVDHGNAQAQAQAQIMGGKGLDILHLGNEVTCEHIQNAMQNKSVKGFELFIYGEGSHELEHEKHTDMLKELGLTLFEDKVLFTDTSWQPTGKTASSHDNESYVEYAKELEGENITILVAKNSLTPAVFTELSADISTPSTLILGDEDNVVLASDPFVFSENSQELHLGGGHDLVTLDSANIRFEDVLMDGGDGMDVLLLGVCDLATVKKGVEAGHITDMEVIVYGSNNQGILSGATSKAEVFEKLGIVDNGQSVSFKDTSKWQENQSTTHQETQVQGYTTFTYAGSADSNDTQMTILIQSQLLN